MLFSEICNKNKTENNCIVFKDKKVEKWIEKQRNLYINSGQTSTLVMPLMIKFTIKMCHQET